jgi:DNA-binding SARP family transcriptional activator/TolB-like protein
LDYVFSVCIRFKVMDERTMLGTGRGEVAFDATPPSQTIVRLRLIGRMEAWTYQSDDVLPTRRKARAMLACIAVASPRPVLRGRLIELLWSRRSQEQARGSLRQEIYRVLEALAPADAEVVVVTRNHLSLRPGAVWIDLQEVLKATATHPDALSLLEGELLEDLNGIDPSFDLWLRHERELLRDRASAIAESWLGENLEPEVTILAAQRLLKIDQSHEGGWRALMRAHAIRGQRGLAVQAYDRCRTVLAETLDSIPSAETQKLLGEIKGSSRKRPPLHEMAPRPKEIGDNQTQATFEPNQSPARGGVRVGVLPLRHAGTSGDDSHLGPGLADEITTALSKFRWLFVVSSNSLARFSGENRDDALIQRDFGLDFLLDGSVIRMGDSIRIHLRLLDLRLASRVVWALRFDSLTTDLLELQDEIAAKVVAQIDPEILLIEARRIAAHPPVDATAYDLMLRAIHLMGSMERRQFEQAGQHLDDAIALDPEYAAAHSWYAYWHIFLCGQDWTDDPGTAMKRAGDLADRAVRLDPFDARGLSISGHISSFLYHRLDEAKLLHDRALSLNSNLPIAWALSAITLAYAGDPEEAERRSNRYKRLSPHDPHAFFFDGFFTVIHLMKRDYEKAVQQGRKIVQLNPAFSATYKPYLAALGHLNQAEEIEKIRAELLSIEPGFTIERFLEATALEREADRQHYAEGLRRAGIPEGVSQPLSRKRISKHPLRAALLT